MLYALLGLILLLISSSATNALLLLLRRRPLQAPPLGWRLVVGGVIGGGVVVVAAVILLVAAIAALLLLVPLVVLLLLVVIVVVVLLLLLLLVLRLQLWVRVQLLEPGLVVGVRVVCVRVVAVDVLALVVTRVVGVARRVLLPVAMALFPPRDRVPLIIRVARDGLVLPPVIRHWRLGVLERRVVVGVFGKCMNRVNCFGTAMQWGWVFMVTG